MMTTTTRRTLRNRMMATLHNGMGLCVLVLLVGVGAVGAAAQSSAGQEASKTTSAGSGPTRVLVQTELGDIVIEVDGTRAPVTAANFLKYVDGGFYDGGSFHRTVKMDNQPDSPVKIEVVQAGVNEARTKEAFPAIPIERTSVTGIQHKDGTVSMARSKPDTATYGWFICINDQPSLDFGGQRNPDGQGFAAFGRVVSGMDIVRKIQQAPKTEAQKLTPPIKILKAARVSS